MRLSAVLAGLAFVGLVPGAIALAYGGHRSGLYPSAAIPTIVGVVLVVALVALFALLPVLRRRLD